MAPSAQMPASFLAQLKVLSIVERKFSVDGGWELDFVLLTAALALIVLGAGAVFLDRLLFGL